MAPVRFGSVTVWGWNGSSGSGFRFWRFLCRGLSLVFQWGLTESSGSGSGFGSRKTVPAVPVPLSVPGQAVLAVPVSGSGSVPEPPCLSKRNGCNEKGVVKLNFSQRGPVPVTGPLVRRGPPLALQRLIPVF